MFAFPDLRSATVFPYPEGTHLEFKQGLGGCPFDKILATICALLNAGGGYLVYGVHDSGLQIKGINHSSADYDALLLKLDTIYVQCTIRCSDAPSNPPAIGAVKTALVAAARGKQLLVVTVRPEEGKRYELADGTRWHRLGASNYRERAVRPVYTEQELASAIQGEREKAKVAIQRYAEDYNTVLGAAKEHLGKFETMQRNVAGIQKELTEIRELLYADILERKKAAEAALVAKPAWWWPFSC